MVQTYQSPVRVYKWPFEVVMAAYEKRFPTCPQIPIVVGTEVEMEEQSPDGSLITVKRKCQLNIDVPYLLKKMSGMDYVYFTQENSLDKRKRRLDIKATNISFSSRIGIIEHCCYYVHPENGEWTCFEQSAHLDIKSFFGFETTVEKIAVKQYAANIQKGKEILEHFIADLERSGEMGRVEEWRWAESAVAPSLSHSDSAIEVSHCDPASDSETDPEEYRDCETGEEPHRRDKKLEADYIQRFLGHLTPLEESRLCQLKYSLQSAHQGKLPNDAHLLRFLRAREFDVAAAKDMVHKSMLWRKSHAVDKILSTYTQPSVVHQFFPGAWHHHDKKGRPLFVLRLGQMDLKGLLRSVGEDGMVKLVLSVCEEGLRRCAEATTAQGRPVSTWGLLVDLEGLSMRHLWRPGVRCAFKIIEIMEAHYPETMGLALLVRCPRVFPVLWTLVGPLIDENTKNKIMVHSSAEVTTDALGEFLQKDVIPHFLGGQCFFMASEGGHVPKALQTFHHTNETPEESPPILESIYTTGYVYKGLPHEVLVRVERSGCVLTWDFDVVKGHCEFSLLRTSELVEEGSRAQPSPPLGALSPGAIVAAMGEASAAPVAFDRSLRLGVNLFTESKPIKALEGDSVQGSHYCSKPGTYIMQWRHTEILGMASPGAFDFSLPGKSKVVYWKEILDSEDFHGSMASIASSQHSFNNLASKPSSASLHVQTPRLPHRKPRYN